MEALIVVDAGAREWRCGWADEEGPEQIMPGKCSSDVDAWTAQLVQAYAALEAEPPSHPVLLSERAGVAESEREAMAAALFEREVPMVYMAAAPLLALYNTGRDTCVLVDVGEQSTSIVVIFEGRNVVDAATLYPLGGGQLAESGVGASCDAFFEPSRLADGGLSPALGLHEVLLRAVQLADVSLRGELLRNIVVVGGGSLLSGFADRLTSELADALRATGATRFEPIVIANADRRLGCWIGGATVGQMPTAAKQFVSAAEFRRNRRVVHERFGALAARSIEAQEAAHKRAAADAVAAMATATSQSRQRAAAMAAEARAWWTASAPRGSADEAARQRLTQQQIVRELDRLALVQVLGDEGQGRRSGRVTLPPSILLALAASALRLLSGCTHGEDDDASLGRRVAHLRAARWASSELNHLGAEVDARAVGCFERRARLNATRRWAAFAARWRLAHDRRRIAVDRWRGSVLRAAGDAWRWRVRSSMRLGRLTGLGRVNGLAHVARRWAATAASLKRLRLATPLGRRALRRRGCKDWQSRSSELAAARLLTIRMRMSLEGWRGLSALRLHAREAKRRRLLGAAAAAVGLSRTLVGSWAVWRTAAAAARRRRVSTARAAAHAASQATVKLWRHVRRSSEAAHRAWWLGRLSTGHWLRLSWSRLVHRTREARRRFISRVHDASTAWGTTPGSSVDVLARALARGLREWRRHHARRSAERELTAWTVERRAASAIERWKAGAYYRRVIHRARMRRVAGRLRRGLRATPRASYRRGLASFKRNHLYEAACDQAFAMGAARLHDRMAATLAYWSKQARWLVQRQRWMRRQVQYMHELQTVLDNAGDCRRWARRLQSIGVEPHVWSEQNLGAVVRRGSTALERALRRESKGSQEGSPASHASPRLSSSPALRASPAHGRSPHMRVLSPAVDAYLSDVLQH